ncbi:cob(I)yrinic acid a,c-diamide adenosyltransferase [Candidatus Heimdallarchaeota archaeon B3_Heim]|nr:MAG: cob(I)yrinic acid a,c-diamide adenosyltransferase [Candidatus Heimdallarchaeota archaeon B3_Heim]
MTQDKQASPSLTLGCIHVITGDGKGKTTSALGLALRAAGHDLKTLMIQFMKKGWDYGELRAVQSFPNIQIIQYGTPDFVNKANPLPIDFQEAQAALAHFKKELSNNWDIIILDEVNVALDYHLISEQEVLDLLERKPKNLEVILTGRYASQAIIDLADYYTTIQSVKHPYQHNINARKGVEF